MWGVQRVSVHEERGAGSYGTMKGTLLESVLPIVTTLTSPVVAPEGTVVVISELDTTVNVSAVPSKPKLVAAVSLAPKC
jgi:hypothetical protein